MRTLVIKSLIVAVLLGTVFITSAQVDSPIAELGLQVATVVLIIVITVF